jgi:hypothetical protein
MLVCELKGDLVRHASPEIQINDGDIWDFLFQKQQGARFVRNWPEDMAIGFFDNRAQIGGLHVVVFNYQDFTSFQLHGSVLPFTEPLS